MLARMALHASGLQCDCPQSKGLAANGFNVLVVDNETNLGKAIEYMADLERSVMVVAIGAATRWAL